MSTTDFLAQIDTCIRRMPPLPPTVGKVMAICNDPQSSPAELNRVIGLDPVLTAKVLKLINSAYYGMRREITSLVRAVVLLGMNTIKNLALSSTVISTLGKGRRLGGLDPIRFWRHCLGVGAVCRRIAQARGVPPGEQEEYFVIGLLHDLGKIPLNTCLADEYGKLLATADDSGEPLFLREAQMFGVDHAGLGRMILDHWNLPGRIGEAVGGHHQPLECAFPQQAAIATVAIADRFVNHGLACASQPDGCPGAPEASDLQIINALGLDPGFFMQQRDRLLDEINRAMVFLELV